MNIFNLFGVNQTEQETLPALPQVIPDWQPAGGDLVPYRGQQIERIVRRVKVDGNVTIYEQEVIFLTDPIPTPKLEERYPVFTQYGDSGFSAAEQAEMVADWKAGRAYFVGGPATPDVALQSYLSRGRVLNGRIYLQE